MPDGRYALIVASSQYSDTTLTQLQAPGHDAASLAAVLGAEAIGGFHVETLADQPAGTVMQEIETFFDGRRREDLVLLYFSGHGILDEGARLYFATTDTRVDRPRSTAVPAAFVNDVMTECRSRRQVLVLDCCNSGSFARGIKAGGNIGTAQRFEGRGRVVITASDAIQYAFEAGRGDYDVTESVFTHVLVDGLRTGKADLNGDGYVSLDELYDYVYGRVLDASPLQRPGKWAFGVEGQILVARTTAASAEPGAVDRRQSSPALAPAERPAAPRRRRPAVGGRRALWGVGAVLAALAIAGAAGYLLTRDAGSKDPREPVAPSYAAGRDATVAVYEAWLSDDLEALDADQISASARDALSRLPTEPVAPSVPSLDHCGGSEDDVTCTYDYPDPIPFHLRFRALFEATGPKVVEVRCNDGNGDLMAGGIPACARMIRDS
jgi:hypothetical protein